MEQKTNKTVLLCVTGLTPQVVTETLYALYKSGQTLPDCIHILTTSEGAERARLTLINDRISEILKRLVQMHGGCCGAGI